MKVIGITGGIASGKSSVSRLLVEMGYVVIDADVAARKVVEKGSQGLSEIILTFGNAILHPDGSLNRAKLAEIIFNDKEKRQQLNNITHPKIREWMLHEKVVAEKKGAEIIFMDIPLLYENNLIALVDKVIVVYVDKKTQLDRLIIRNGLTEEEATARIQSQMPLDEKKLLADFIIDNNGTPEEMKQQLLNVLQYLKS